MIDKKIQQLASEHADQMASKGVFITARNGTPLSELLSHCRPDGEGGFTTTEDFASSCEGIADFQADNIRNYLDFARNTAKPALAAIDAVVQAGLSQINIDPFVGMSLVEMGAPTVLEDSEFLNSVSHYNSGNDVVPAINPRYAPRPTEQLIEACMTGNGAWDLAIKDWLGSIDEGQLQSVWQSVFMDKANNPTTAPIVPLTSLLSDFNQGRFSALIVFLIASRLHSNIDDEFGASLSDARQFLYAVLQAAATHIERGINWYNSFVSTSSLVASVDKQAKSIKVNRTVYKQFLAEGGKADVLMGMIVAGKTYYTIAEIQAHADELLASWAWYTQSRQSESEAAYEAQARELMVSAFTDSLEQPIGELETEMLAKPGVKETALQAFRAELATYSRGQIHANYRDVLWRSACRGRFYYHTTTYDLLDAIDYQVRERGVNAEDAATIATQQLVAKYLTEMLKPA